MQTVQGPVLHSLRSVESFLEEHADKLGSVVKTGARRRLAATVVDLVSHVTDQSGSVIASEAATRKYRELRRELMRDHMALIARIARANLPPMPVVEPLRMPRGRPTAERLAQLAYGMAKAAEPHASSFVALGLSQDFVQRVIDAADAMLAALTERAKSRGRRGGATRGIKTQLSAGRKIVHILDAFVSTELKNDPVLLREWDLVKRVGKPVGRGAGTTSPADGSSGGHQIGVVEGMAGLTME